jgi:extracellular elastinolytic metalloproteinase
LYGGANKCLIWEVFARRGLGYSADQGSSEDRTDQTEAFDLHPDCIEGAGLGEKGLEAVVIYPNPAKDVLNIDMTGYSQVTAIRIVDLQGKVLFETNAIQTTKLAIDLSAFRSGVYLVQLTDIHGAESVAIVKH